VSLTIVYGHQRGNVADSPVLQADMGYVPYTIACQEISSDPKTSCNINPIPCAVRQKMGKQKTEWLVPGSVWAGATSMTGARLAFTASRASTAPITRQIRARFMLLGLS
jgi:hypothetical protein